MKFYFAYGSNMNPARVRQRGLAVLAQQGARLPDYRLTFDKMSRDHVEHGHANIHYVRGACTEGVLYELSAASEILKMDPFERAPWNYGREIVEVHTDAGSAWAWTYFANPAVRVTGLRPTADYLAHLLAGAEFLSADYVATLRALHTAEKRR